MDFEKILDKILVRLAEYQIKGNFDINSIDSIVEIEKVIESVLKDEGYYDNLKDYKKQFSSNLKEVVSTYKSFGAVSGDLKAFNDLAFQNFYEKLAGGVTDTNIKQPIKDALIQYVAADGKYKDFKTTVKDVLTANKVEGNIDTIAREYAFQYKRAQGQILAEKYNVQYFIYQGTEIDTTREFCEARIGNIYSKDEIESWASEDWAGKIKGTNSTNIFQVCGGWNCRHDLMPVPKSLAESRGFNVYN